MRTPDLSAWRRRRGATLLPALVVAIMLAAIAATLGWQRDRDATRSEAAARQALAVVPAAAKAIFSYDHRTFDESVANGLSFATAPFAGEYTQTTSALKETAVKQQAVVLAEVSSAGVITAEPGRVELLVYVNQYRRNVNTTGEKVDQNRVVLTLVAVEGEWRVAKAIAV